MTGVLTIRGLDLGDEVTARAGHAELAGEGFTFLLDLREAEPWADYLSRVDRWPDGDGMPPGWVRNRFLIGDLGRTVIGRVAIRYELTDYLAEFGGHIGYAVRPAFRRHGYATLLLQHGLTVARDAGIDRVLVTCDDTNVASTGVIEASGGCFERLTDPAENGAAKRRYWFPL